MASSTILPFNHQPISTFASSSYTVAAGLYAYARPLGAECTVNASAVFAAGSASFPTASGSRIVAPPGFTGRIRTGAESSDKSLGVGGTTVAQLTASGTTRIDAYFLNGAITSVVAGTLVSSSSTSINGNSISITTASNTTVVVTPANLMPLWLNEGDVLAGGPWLISTYNQIT